jgi:hypothetical protein
MIQPSLLNVAELPVDIMFSPKMYGKLHKGVLVVDTLDSQYMFDVVGKTPDYVPPVVTKGALDTMPESPEKPRPKRNVIRDNIESVRIAKPKLDQK